MPLECEICGKTHIAGICRDVRVGDIWLENDGRFTRNVTVMQVKGTRVRIKGAVRSTWASIKRFDGRRRGYTLVERAKSAAS